jgi:hypothetical protein
MSAAIEGRSGGNAHREGPSTDRPDRARAALDRASTGALWRRRPKALSRKELRK